MKCTNNRIKSLCILSIMLFTTGCGQKIEFDQSYELFQTTNKYQLMEQTKSTEMIGDQGSAFFADKLCVIAEDNLEDETVSSDLSEASGIFNTFNLSVDYARNVHEKLYPASTTKILTAYVALKHGNIEDTITVSEQALDLEAGSSLCGLSVGDVISLEELLYGLMMESGNDASNVIAELISGSMEDFVSLMNEEAKKMGAVKSHFMNAHGLHDEEHYTTIYDLYLITNQAIKNDKFLEIIKADKHTANYFNKEEEPVTKEWTTSNQYLTGDREIPSGVSVIGGKTGTTNAAGFCLVLVSETKENQPYISIVLKAGNRDQLYLHMSQLLEKISK